MFRVFFERVAAVIRAVDTPRVTKSMETVVQSRGMGGSSDRARSAYREAMSSSHLDQLGG